MQEIATEKMSFRPVWRSFIPHIIFFWLVIPLVMMLWERYSHKLIVSPDCISLKNGIFNIVTTEVTPESITGMEVRQNILQRILCYGSIYIGTSATSGYEIVFHGLSCPSEVSDMIKMYRR